MWHLADLMDASFSHLTQRMSVIALDHLAVFAARANKILETNKRRLDEFLGSAGEIETVRAEFGTLAFPRLRRGDADEFFDFLREKFETTVVPGHFFDMRQNFRVGIGGDVEMVAGGLERLAEALRKWCARKPV